MREILGLAVWLVGWVIATRLTYAWLVREGEHPGVLMPAFLGALWPVVLGVCLAMLPFAAVGWLASLGVKR